MAEDMERRILDAFLGPAPVANPEGLQRVLERRAAGERGQPGRAGRTRFWVSIVSVSAIAATLLVMVSPGTQNQRPQPDRSIPGLAEAALMPGMLMAQGSAHPLFEPVAAGTDLQPGEWTYAWLDTGFPDSSMLHRIRQLRTTYQAAPAWLLLSRSGPLDSLNQFRDSTWIDDASFRLLARSFAVSGNGRITEEYREHEVLQGLTISGSTSWKVLSLDTTDAVYNGFSMPTSIVSMIARRAPLKAGWTGSVPVQALPSDSRMVVRWFDLAVVGEASLTVPAGSFDCWKIRLGQAWKYSPESGFFFYISKERRWLIQEGIEGVGPQKHPWKSVLVSAREE